MSSTKLGNVVSSATNALDTGIEFNLFISTTDIGCGHGDWVSVN